VATNSTGFLWVDHQQREKQQHNNYYYYIHLTAFFQDNLGKPATESQTILVFIAARDDGVAVASAGPYAIHLHLAPDRQPCQYLTTQFFTGRIPFLSPNQQHQSTEVNQNSTRKKHKIICAFSEV